MNVWKVGPTRRAILVLSYSLNSDPLVSASNHAISKISKNMSLACHDYWQSCTMYIFLWGRMEVLTVTCLLQPWPQLSHFSVWPLCGQVCCLLWSPSSFLWAKIFFLSRFSSLLSKSSFIDLSGDVYFAAKMADAAFCKGTINILTH